VELIRYRPGEALRWLETGAQDLKKNAQRQGKSVVRREGERNIGKDVRQFAGALVDMGKGALADLRHAQAKATEYILHENRFEVVSPNHIRSVDYSQVASIKVKGDRATVVLDQRHITIKPHAYILAGRVKVPIGWSRNGLEVPYELLLDELSARCNLDVEYAA